MRCKGVVRFNSVPSPRGAMTDTPIALIEDNADDVALTLDAFKACAIPCRIDVLRDGSAALDFLLPPAGTLSADLPALVLLDLKLPKIDGLTVLRNLRADSRTKYLPIVVLTTSREPHDIAASYEFGANSYVRKPVDYDEFLGVVRQISAYWLGLNRPLPPKP